MTTIQEWISENRYSNSIPKRTAAITAKIGIEGTIVAGLSLALTLVLYAVLTVFDLSIPEAPDSFVAIWLLLLGLGIRLFWCYTSDEREG